MKIVFVDPLTHFQRSFMTVWPGCEFSKVAARYGR